MGQNPIPPVNIPIQPLTWGGEATSQPTWDPKTVLTTTAVSRLRLLVWVLRDAKNRCEAIGIEAPGHVDGVAQQKLDGISAIGSVHFNLLGFPSCFPKTKRVLPKNQ